MIVEIPGVGNVEFPDDTPPEAVKNALAQYATPKAPPPPTQVENDIKALTDQATAAFGAGNDAEGKRLLAEASQMSIDSGLAPEGYVVNPEGQMEDLRSPANPNIPTGRGVSLGVGALQGLGFGGGDEAVAALHGATGGDYDYELSRMREVERRAAEDHPGYYYGGLIPGAVASSVSAGKALGINPQGANLLGTAGKGAAIGGGEGTIWGALSGEGGAGNRAKRAIVDALKGAGTGFAAPFAVAGGAKALGAVGDVISGGFDAMLNRANTGRANRAMMDTVKKSGQSVDDIAASVEAAAREGQPEFRLMDATGKAGQRRASGVVRSGGDGAEELAQFLEGRQLDQASRVGSFVDDAFGTTGTTAAKTQAGLKEARGAAADVAYEAARKGAGPVNLNPVIDKIDELTKRNPILGESALSKTEIGSRLAGLRGKLQAEGEQLIDFDSVLNIKQDLFETIQNLKKSGKSVPKQLSEVYDALDQSLEAASSGYRAANDGFREATKVINSVDSGAEMARPRARSADTTAAFRAMTPEQQAAARVGYGDSVLSRIEANAAPTSNKARPLNSPKAAAEAEAMAVDPRLFANRITRENTMWETQNRALGGSRTADNLADVADVGAMADIGRALKDGLTGRIGSAVGGVARMAGNAATGQNEATRTLIAKLLMSNDPKAALTQALRQETTSQGQRRIVEALVRALGRQASPQF